MTGWPLDLLASRLDDTAAAVSHLDRSDDDAGAVASATTPAAARRRGGCGDSSVKCFQFIPVGSRFGEDKYFRGASFTGVVVTLSHASTRRSVYGQLVHFIPSHT